MLGHQCLHELFEQQAERAPTAIAVSMGREACTYAGLNAQANRIAHHLRALGVRSETRVGLCVERGIGMIAAILGILKAGAAYVPLDPAYPQERLKLLISDSNAALVLTTRALASAVPGLETARIVQLDRDIAAGWPKENLGAHAPPSSAAYVIYTSGSSGLPKGVVVEHRHVVRLFSSTEPWFHFGSSDVWTLFHSFGFDFSVWEMWGALLYGGRLVVVPADTSRAPDAFYELLERERVTVLNQTPSAFQLLSRLEESGWKRGALALRFVIFGGEALDPQMLRGWISRHGDSTPELINMYGITETTVHVTYRRITREDAEQGAGSPIGRPLPDLSVYLLDESGSPVAPGQPGELFVGGAGVSRGYLNRPELQAQRFLPDTFSREPNARLYRSGDLAMTLPDGSLVYLGRVDAQVKVRGFRIEPGEVESCLRRSPGVSEVVVVARDYGEGDKRLIAYVVPALAGSATLAEELRSLAGTHLPEHMRPSAYVLLDELPLTPHGKIDRSRLPAPDTRAGELSAPDGSRAATPFEQALADIWKKTLGVSSVGPHDDFFDLGGTSLGAVKILFMVQERLGITLDMSAWAEHASIAQFAELISSQAQAQPASAALAAAQASSPVSQPS